MRYAPVACAIILAASASADESLVRELQDAGGDTRIRRTDPGANGAIHPAAVLPDLLKLEVSGWDAPDPIGDPFEGTPIENAHLLRIEITLSGLVNPAGTMGLNGLAYDPFRYGPSPLLGFVELDVDRDRDTGGELGGAAEATYLANVGRFGTLPSGSIGERAARGGEDLDSDFYTPPFFERSGSEFVVIFCGCHNVSVVDEGGDGNGLFDAGERWVVRGRYFQRAGGYQCASAIFGGSSGGTYDPEIEIEFEHDVDDDETKVTVVFPLDMQGAALLTGEPEQAVDSAIGIGGSHFSMLEALQDVVDAADGLNGPLSGPCRDLVDEWRGDSVEDHLEPVRWRANAIVGTAYLQQQPSLYVWTDVGFEHSPGDVNASGFTDPSDEDAISDHIAETDAGAMDADGVANGVRVIPNFGPNFSVFDLDADGQVDAMDVQTVADYCTADANGDQVINILDLLAFLDLWFDLEADLDGDDVTTILDLLVFLDLWFRSC